MVRYLHLYIQCMMLWRTLFVVWCWHSFLFLLPVLFCYVRICLFIYYILLPVLLLFLDVVCSDSRILYTVDAIPTDAVWFCFDSLLESRCHSDCLELPFVLRFPVHSSSQWNLIALRLCYRVHFKFIHSPLSILRLVNLPRVRFVTILIWWISHTAGWFGGTACDAVATNTYRFCVRWQFRCILACLLRWCLGAVCRCRSLTGLPFLRLRSFPRWCCCSVPVVLCVVGA